MDGFLGMFIEVRTEQGCHTMDAVKVFVKGYVSSLKLHEQGGLLAV